MAKKNLKLHAVVAPAQTVIVSAYDEDGKPDACTLAFYTMSSHKPPCVTIAINATARRKTLKSILSSGAFVVGYPGNNQVKEADYLGVESGYNVDKLEKIGLGQCVHAPVINELLLSLECKVVHQVTIGSHTQITGEIKNIQADESILNDKDKILLNELKPIIYDEESFSYYELGDTVADAFKTGAEFKKSFINN